MGIAILGAGWVLPDEGAPLRRDRWAGKGVALFRIDRLCALSLCAVDEAFVDAGVVPAPGAMPAGWDAERVAVYLGTAYGCHATDEEFYRGVQAQAQAGGTPLLGASPRLFAHTLPSSPVGMVSIHYGLLGPGLAMVSGAASGLLAVAAALRALRRGRVAQAVVLTAEVGTPFLRQMQGDDDTRDGAAALLLGGSAQGPRGRVLAVASGYQASNPAGAMAEVLRRLPGDAERAAYCDENTAALLHGTPLPCRVMGGTPGAAPSATGAVGALLLLGRLGETGEKQALVLSCDRHGQAAAALWKV